MLAAMISQASRSVEVSIRRVASVRKKARMMLDPVAPEVDQQADRAADVQHHDEREPEGLGLGLARDQVVPAEQRREQHGVAEARDREELGDALQQPEHDRLERRDRVADRAEMRVRARWSRGPSSPMHPSRRAAALVCSSPRPPERGERMSVDGTWKITIQTPMGAQELDDRARQRRQRPDRHPERQRRVGPDLRRQRRRRQRDLEGRHHPPDVADGHLQGEGRRATRSRAARAPACSRAPRSAAPARSGDARPVTVPGRCAGSLRVTCSGSR